MLQFSSDSIRTIACVGEVMVELIRDGESSARLGVAGDTFNTAVYLQRLLGSRAAVSYVTALGKDAFSDMILDAMGGHGLQTGSVVRHPDKSPGLYAISTDDTGERSFTYWRSDSAARTMFGPGSPLTPEGLGRFDMVLLTGISLAILPPQVRSGLIAALPAAQKAGVKVVYDSNHRPRLWESVEAAREVNAQMWALADIALPSVDDEMAVFGDADEAAVLARLHRQGARFGALKRGAQGPRDLSGEVPPQDYPPAPKVIDTTAAGDSFNAGFLAGLIESGDIATALRGGHDTAARVVQQRGAIVDF